MTEYMQKGIPLSDMDLLLVYKIGKVLSCGVTNKELQQMSLSINRLSEDRLVEFSFLDSPPRVFGYNDIVWRATLALAGSACCDSVFNDFAVNETDMKDFEKYARKMASAGHVDMIYWIWEPENSKEIETNKETFIYLRKRIRDRLVALFKLNRPLIDEVKDHLVMGDRCIKHEDLVRCISRFNDTLTPDVHRPVSIQDASETIH